MPFSCFQPFGLLRFSSEKPLAQAIYEQIRASHGSAYDNESFYGVFSAKWYADAMAIARSRMALKRAGNQADPHKVSDLLPDFEGHYGIVPGANATLASRHEALAAAMQIALGPRRGNVEYQLRAALGDDFVAWVTTDAGPETSYPDHPWQDIGIFNDPALWKTIRIVESVPFTGTSLLRHFEHVSGDDGGLVVGDKLVVQPGDLGQQDLIEVTARTGTTFRAVFRRPHSAGAIAIRRPWPFWCANSKSSAVVVKNGRASDATVRERVTRVLRKLLGNGSLWSIVEENTVAGTAGPHIPGSVIPAITPAGALTF